MSAGASTVDGTDLIQALMDTLKESEEAVRQMRRDGRAYAEAERDYRIALAVKTSALRSEGMPATLTPDLAKGDPDVAALRFIRDMSRAEWEADRANVDRLKNQAWIVERQIEREMR